MFLDLSCDAFVQKLSDQMVYFFDILCQTTSFQDVERLMKMATSLSQFTRDLIKLSLQQTIILVGIQFQRLSFYIL